MRCQCYPVMGLGCIILTMVLELLYVLWHGGCLWHGAANAAAQGPRLSESQLEKASQSREADLALRREQRLSPHRPLRLVPRDSLFLFGNPVPSGVQLIAGISTVARKKGPDTVLKTIESLLRSAHEKVAVVVHLADFNLSWVESIAHDLQEAHSDVIAGGYLHALHAPEELYPPLDACAPDCPYKEDSTSARQRLKQNVDYAFLMHYAAPLAQYYIQLQDNLLFARQWSEKVLDFVQTEFPPDWRSDENTPWRTIIFTGSGFIGRLFQSKELGRLAQFQLMFYDQLSAEGLQAEFASIMTQASVIEYPVPQNGTVLFVCPDQDAGGSMWDRFLRWTIEAIVWAALKVLCIV